MMLQWSREETHNKGLNMAKKSAALMAFIANDSIFLSDVFCFLGDLHLETVMSSEM